MSIDMNDPRLTAYALDELDERERREVETLLADSPEASKAVEEIRQAAGWIESELKSEPVATLTTQQRKTIETAMFAKRVSRWVPFAAAACLFLVVGVFGVVYLVPSVQKAREFPPEALVHLERNVAPANQPIPAIPKEVGEHVALASKDKKTLEGLGYASIGNNANAVAPTTPYTVNDLTGPIPTFRGRQINLDDVGADGDEALAIRNGVDVETETPPPPQTASGIAKSAKISSGRRGEEVPEQRGTAYKLAKGSAATRSTIDSHVVFGQPELISPSDRTAGGQKNPGWCGTMDHWRKNREAQQSGAESYASIQDNPFTAVTQSPLSTFSIDVDTASYSNIRRFITSGQLPPPDAVRIEEMINYFTYDYPQPSGEDPFSVNVEVAGCPWETTHQLLRIGLKGKTFADEARPASNLVFLVDVSGSMAPENKLPLLKKAMGMLTAQLRPQDRVAIVVYAGASGLVLPSTTCNNQQTISHALDNLQAGGSTNGGAGIELAYQQATENFIQGGVNRVILATDGDFNVGITDQNALVNLIEQKAKTGVFLSVLGFGMGNLKDATLEKLADKGNGNYAYIDTLNEAKKVLVDQMGGTLVTIAKDVKIQIEFNPAKVQAYRLIGYENRILAAQDFNDDRKDAGEIGAGHTVTALYELVPPGVNMAGVDPLKYQPHAEAAAPVVASVPTSNEMLTVKLRYKQPTGHTSQLIERPVSGETGSFSASSHDFRFAAAVASFGMLLRHSPHSGNANFDTVLEMAGANLGADLNGYRAEFIELVRKAKTLRPS